MNRKWGFRRFLFILAGVVSVVCAGLSVYVVLDIHSAAQRSLRWEQIEHQKKYDIFDRISLEDALAERERREALTPEDRAAEEIQREPFAKERATANAKLEELENGFWVNLSKGSLVGMCSLSGLVGGITGFIIVWLICWVIYWPVRGFHKIGKERILQIIKWAAIIFFASILFHLADHVVHKTINAFEEKPSPRGGFSR